MRCRAEAFNENEPQIKEIQGRHRVQKLQPHLEQHGLAAEKIPNFEAWLSSSHSLILLKTTAVEPTHVPVL